MSAQAEQQIADLHAVFCGLVASESAFATPGEGPIWTIPGLLQNDDSFIHPMYTAFAAFFGQPWALATLNTIAAIDLTANPAEVENVALAVAVLAYLNKTTPAPITPVVPTPTPTPAPAPTPTPVTPAGTINTAQLLGYLKEALTVLGGIGTWATAVHNAWFGLSGTPGAVVPALLGAGTTVLAAHAVSGKRVAEKQLTTLKGTRS